MKKFIIMLLWLSAWSINSAYAEAVIIDLNSKNGVWSLEDAELSKKSYIAEFTTGKS